MPRITGIFGAAPDINHAVEEIVDQGYRQSQLAVTNGDAGAGEYGSQFMGGELGAVENNAYGDYVRQQEPGSSMLSLDARSQDVDDLVEVMRMCGAVDVLVEGQRPPVNRA
ncbi:MAG: hypothetical protein ACM3ZQ_09820 [Bacillota bacterium]